MGLIEKIAFWKKDEEFTPLDPETGPTRAESPPAGSQGVTSPSGFDDIAGKSSDEGITAPPSDATVSPPPPPPSQASEITPSNGGMNEVDDSQFRQPPGADEPALQQPQDSSSMRPSSSPEFSSPSVSPSPSMSMGSQTSYGAGMEHNPNVLGQRDFEVLNAKLDTLKLMLDNLSMRVKTIEKIALDEQEKAKRDDWY